MSLLRQSLGRTYLKLMGWQLDDHPPLPKKCVFIAAPHTSNWDLVYALAATYIMDINIHWLGKHTLFAPPLGWFMRWLGGVPVDRRGRQNLVAQVVAMFAERDELILVVPPEGTRKKAEFWKSGFYHIAKEAKVPIFPGYVDFGSKRCGVGPAFYPSEDVAADMERLRAFYAPIRGKYPEHESVPRLKEETPKTSP